jgi:hypothetical protein
VWHTVTDPGPPNGASAPTPNFDFFLTNVQHFNKMLIGSKISHEKIYQRPWGAFFPTTISVQCGAYILVLHAPTHQ